jgi:hypothetical protein
MKFFIIIGCIIVLFYILIFYSLLQINFAKEIGTFIGEIQKYSNSIK